MSSGQTKCIIYLKAGDHVGFDMARGAEKTRRRGIRRHNGACGTCEEGRKEMKKRRKKKMEGEQKERHFEKK